MLLILWYIWNFFFFIVRKDLLPWTRFRQAYFTRLYFYFGFSYKSLNFFEKWFFNLFYTSTGFSYLFYTFTNRKNFFRIRLKESPLMYVFMSYYSVFNVDLVNDEKLNNISEDIFYYKKSLSNLIVDKFRNNYSITLRFFILKDIILKNYYKFYMYRWLCLEFENSTKLVFVYPSNLLFTISYLLTTLKPTRVVIYDVSKISDFYIYMGKKKNFALNLRKRPKNFNFLKKKYFFFLQSLYARYKKLYKNVFNVDFSLWSKKMQEVVVSKFNNSSFFLIDYVWTESLKKSLYIRFSDSSVSKYIQLHRLEKYSVQYLRKNRIFNKGRYSRNRQLYRTGFYWCLWLNILVVYGLYFFFYRFMFTFGYLGWGLAFLACAFVFARACQLKLYNPLVIFQEILDLYTWIGFILKSFIDSFFIKASFVYSFFLSFFYSSILFNTIKSTFFFYYLYKIINFIQIKYQWKRSQRFFYIWEYFQGEDTSFLRIKSKIHWFKQVYKMLTT